MDTQSSSAQSGAAEYSSRLGCDAASLCEFVPLLRMHHDPMQHEELVTELKQIRFKAQCHYNYLL